MRKIVLFSFLLLFCAILLFWGDAVGGTDSALALAGGDGRFTVLAVGLDEAAGNTDVILLTSVDRGAREITVLQIPRDTYFRAETAQEKLNQVYPALRQRGLSPTESLDVLSSNIGSAFGIPIDHYVVFDLAAVSLLVDEIGGVTVDLPMAVRYRVGDAYTEIPSGIRNLTGEEAVRFLRHRMGYVEGDLGRVDAQKLLLIAVYRKLKNELSFSDLATVFPKVYPMINTDMALSEGIAYAYSVYRDRAEYTVRLVTLPGEAVRAGGDSGLWYYATNRAAAAEIIQRYFGGGETFDAEGALLNGAHDAFYNVYYDKAYSYSVYTEDTIDKLKVKIK